MITGALTTAANAREQAVAETDGEVILIKGRPYRLRLDPLNCVGQRHYHPELHADGTPGEEPHHHHSPRCAEIPRQATLIPMWEKTAERHVHAFTDGKCACGATREEMTEKRIYRAGDKRPDKQLVGYRNPPDAEHPSGWSYTRKEERG